MTNQCPRIGRTLMPDRDKGGRGKMTHYPSPPRRQIGFTGPRAACYRRPVPAKLPKRLTYVVLGASLIASLPAADAGAQVVVSSCGQIFSGDGVLAGDLDCSTTSGYALQITSPGSLDLAGFT